VESESNARRSQDGESPDEIDFYGPDHRPATSASAPDPAADPDGGADAIPETKRESGGRRLPEDAELAAGSAGGTHDDTHHGHSCSLSGEFIARLRPPDIVPAAGDDAFFLREETRMGSLQRSRREFLKTAGFAAGATAVSGTSAALGMPLSSVAKASKHVLLISVDGFHAIDLERWIKSNPTSILSLLSQKGITYTAARVSPSDSFPGLMALVTGGSPRSTGIWYDVAFDRELLPPGGGTPGTVTQYMEAINLDAGNIPTNTNRLDGGVMPPRAVGDYQFLPGEGIDHTQLPLDPATLAPVYPWRFLRTNTIFEVVKAHGGRTAWCDKHVGAYQAVHGPSGNGVDDYFSPEINSPASQLDPDPLLPAGDQFTGSHIAIKLYDTLKVKAVVNQCRGLNSTGKHRVGTPAVFGMNFQALSVGQKLAHEVDSALLGGYVDADGTPNTAIQSALQFVDDSLGEMVVALAEQEILEKTTIIITAKHGQSPIDLAKRRIVPAGGFDTAIAPVVGAGNYAVTADDAAYIWLKKGVQNKTADVVKALWASPDLTNLPAVQTPPSGTPLGVLPWPASPGIDYIFWGDTLKLQWSDPEHDSRQPDIIVVPTPGIIYAGKKSGKLAEHGGLAFYDGNVALLVSNPGLSRKTLKTPVNTTQVAPTILKLLGLNPAALEAVQKEKTDELPAEDA
jgi:hypothetical protein